MVLKGGRGPDPSHDILADLAVLTQDDEFEYDAREALEGELAQRFTAWQVTEEEQGEHEHNDDATQ